MSMNGKIVLISGAGSGIGRAAAIEFARRGAQVVATDINQSGLDALSNQLSGLERSIVSTIADASSPGECERVGDLVKKRFGRLDVAVNNVGVGDYEPGHLLAD